MAGGKKDVRGKERKEKDVGEKEYNEGVKEGEQGKRSDDYESKGEGRAKGRSRQR